MKAQIDENNYFVQINTDDCNIEIEDYNFEYPCKFYRRVNGKNIFSKKKYNDFLNMEKLMDLRNRREAECFSFINRSDQFYWNQFTLEQKEEARQWYVDWLKVTDTLKPPSKPRWLR